MTLIKRPRSRKPDPDTEVCCALAANGDKCTKFGYYRSEIYLRDPRLYCWAHAKVAVRRTPLDGATLIVPETP